QGPDLVLAADQFVIHPVTRIADEARVRAAGDEARTVIAGYHWFTDWGRDTMISLPGLTLATGRTTEAGYILRTFAHYVRDGLIPNLFPEGQNEGLYHTADATLWFFQALARYVDVTGDQDTLEHHHAARHLTGAQRREALVDLLECVGAAHQLVDLEVAGQVLVDQPGEVEVRTHGAVHRPLDAFLLERHHVRRDRRADVHGRHADDHRGPAGPDRGEELQRGRLAPDGVERVVDAAPAGQPAHELNGVRLRRVHRVGGPERPG